MAQDDFLTFIERIKQAESRGQRYDSKGNLLTSPKGAQGEMQVMPATQRAPGFGVAPVKNNSPEEIARVGRDILRAFDAKYGGNRMYIAAAYNWGPGNADKWIAAGADFNKLPEETQKYLRKVVPEALTPSRDQKPAPRATAVTEPAVMEPPPGISASAGGKTIAIGDSLAVGFAQANKLDGLHKGGAGPKAVLKMVQDYAANNNLEGVTVYLGTGLPNNPAQRDFVTKQVDLIKSKGGIPVLFGAGPGSEKTPTTGQNEFLQSVAQSTGAQFTGPLADRFPNISKQDRTGLHLTHPQYRQLFSQMGGAAPAASRPAAASPAPEATSTAAASAAAPAAVAAAPVARPEDLGSGYKAALALSFLGSEDRDRPTTESELEDRLNETALAEFNKELEDYTPKNALQDLEITAFRPFKPAQPVMMAEGGEVKSRPSEAEEMLRRFGAQGMAGSRDGKTMAEGEFSYTHPLDDDTKLKLGLMGRYVKGPGLKHFGVDEGNIVYEWQLDKDSSIRAMLGSARGKGINRGSLTYSRQFADGGEAKKEESKNSSAMTARETLNKVFGLGMGPMGMGANLGYNVYKHLSGKTPLEDLLRDAKQANLPIDPTKDMEPIGQYGGMPPIRRSNGSPETGEVDKSENRSFFSRLFGGSNDDFIERTKSKAQENEDYRAMLEYLKSRDAVPDVKTGFLPYGIDAAFSSMKLPLVGAVGSGTIKINKDIIDSDYKKTIGPSTLAHEMAHAADRQFEQQAREQTGIFSKGNNFTDAYEKMVGSGGMREGKRRTDLARRYHPEWAAANRDYRATPYEIAAHGVGKYAGPTTADDAPPHVDATAATEFMILLDLARRNSKEGNVGQTELDPANRPAFVTPNSGIGRKQGPISRMLNADAPVRRSNGSPETGERALTPEEIAAASRPATFNPNIARQGAAARALAAQRDVNTLPDPRTYAAVSGFLGEAPDELGFSVMHPDIKGITTAGEAGYAAGLVPLVAPVVAPIARAAGRAATALGMKAEKALEAPVTRTLEGGGRSAEMLKALGAQPSFAVPPSRPIFQHLPTSQAPFVGRLDDFVAAMPGPVQKDQFLGQLKVKFRDYDIKRAEETLSDLPSNAKINPVDLLNRIKSKYDPSSFQTTVIPPKNASDFFQQMDNIFADRADDTVGRLGMIHLSHHVPPDKLLQINAAKDLESALSKAASMPDLTLVSGNLERVPIALANSVQKSDLPLSAPVKTALTDFLANNQSLFQKAGGLSQAYEMLRFPAISKKWAPLVNRHTAEIMQATGQPWSLEISKQAQIRTIENFFDDANQTLASYGFRPLDKPHFPAITSPYSWYTESPMLATQLETSFKKATGLLSNDLKEMSEKAKELKTLVQKDLKSVLPYRDQHASLRSSPDPIAFSRFSEHVTEIPGVGKANGIYVHELQSDRLDDIRKLGKRGGTPQADKQAVDEIDNKLAGSFVKRDQAQAQGDNEAVARLNDEIDGLSYRRARLFNRMRSGEYNVSESFANMENLPQVAQQLMAKNAVIGAIQMNKRFVAFPGKESAQSQLYEKLPRNLKDVVKDLGPGFEVRPITLQSSQGLESMHNAIVWSPEAAARLQKKGVPFKSGGMVERQNTDNRAYL